MLAPHHSHATGFIPKRVRASLVSPNPSCPRKQPASSSAQPSLQVIKQRRGQGKLPTGLRARRKSNGRKRESNRSQSQRVCFLGGSSRQLLSAARLGIVLPGAEPEKAASAGTLPGGLPHRSSRLWQRCPFCQYCPAVPSANPACAPCHLVLTLQADTSSRCQLGSCAAVPKAGGRSSRSSPVALGPHYFWSDGMGWTQGRSLCLHPAPKQRPGPGDGTCRLPTTCKLPRDPRDVQNLAGSP